VESALREGGREPGLRLIETLRWEGGFLREGLHLARMARGAAALGWGFPQAAVLAALHAGRGPVAERVRVTLDSTGVVEVTAAPHTPAKGPWRVGLAKARLESGDPWLTVKTTRRAVYDDARAMLAGLDEAVFLNERGEVGDGTITTVFFDQGEGLRTPPLSCGLLPGVLRAEMLALGLCREEVLRGEDLGQVRLWVGNSLRGMIEAEWADQTAT
jgi:4-amino-4-deoxychorismate lyase